MLVGNLDFASRRLSGVDGADDEVEFDIGPLRVLAASVALAAPRRRRTGAASGSRVRCCRPAKRRPQCIFESDGRAAAFLQTVCFGDAVQDLLVGGGRGRVVVLEIPEVVGVPKVGFGLTRAVVDDPGAAQDIFEEGQDPRKRFAARAPQRKYRLAGAADGAPVPGVGQGELDLMFYRSGDKGGGLESSLVARHEPIGRLCNILRYLVEPQSFHASLAIEVEQTGEDAAQCAVLDSEAGVGRLVGHRLQVRVLDAQRVLASDEAAQEGHADAPGVDLWAKVGDGPGRRS